MNKRQLGRLLILFGIIGVLAEFFVPLFDSYGCGLGKQAPQKLLVYAIYFLLMYLGLKYRAYQES